MTLQVKIKRHEKKPSQQTKQKVSFVCLVWLPVCCLDFLMWFRLGTRDTKITNFWKTDIEKQDLKWESRLEPAAIVEVLKRSVKTGWPRGLCVTRSHRLHFPEVTGENILSVWPTDSEGNRSFYIMLHVQSFTGLAALRPLSTWNQPIPTSRTGPRSQPELHQLCTALRSKKKTGVQHQHLGRCTRARKAAINICIQSPLKGHIKGGSVFVIPSQKQQWSLGAEVESANQ